MKPSTSMTLYPPPNSPCGMPELLEENCAICGFQVKSNRLGSPACLGCIVFFRKSVIKNAKYKCSKSGNCPTFLESRGSCRQCRYQKCLQVGMKPEFVVHRDLLVPQNTPPLYCETTRNLMESLVRLQERQFEEHKRQCVKQMRRATVSDVNEMFKWSFNNAIEWASQFYPFSKLSNEHQKCVISEYGFSFFIIDQGFKGAFEKRSGYWMLQNGTYLHWDYCRGLENDEITVDQKLVKQHFEFVIYLETSIKRQLQILHLDEFEMAALKSLLLFSNSFPKQHIFKEFQDLNDSLKNKCLGELMEYLMEKLSDSYDERFGELILFIGEIRAAIKVVYNQMKVSDLFDSSKFNLYVQSFLLS